MTVRIASALWSIMGRAGLRAAAVAVCLLLGVAVASAEYCRQLEAQLVALGAASRANPQQIGRYDAAIASQQGELQKANLQARNAGCSAGGGPLCVSLNATIQRMNNNLADLQNTRQRLVSSVGMQAERARLTAAIESSGCRTARHTERSIPVPSEAPAPEIANGGVETRTGSGDTQMYRTMCVRMCDGFFFPVSHSTPRGMFQRDEKLCAARCPGTAVELHYHRFPGEESEDMVSAASGLPYREADNAFRYRQSSWERPASCGCGVDRGFDVLAGERQWEPLGPLEGTTAAIERPEATPPTRQDSGSFVIREGLPAREPAQLPPAPAETELTEEATLPLDDAEAEEDAGERRIRLVGPTFLPAPEEAIDLRSPAPSRAR
jgi:hypothetical protein